MSRLAASDFERVPLSENPGFEGYVSQYDTFNNEEGAGPSNMEMEEIGGGNQKEDEDVFDQDLQHDIISSLPSSQFRMIKNMAGADKILHQERDETQDIEDTPRLLRTTSELTPRDVVMGEDNLVIHGMTPDHTSQLKDMTTTLQSKKSVRMRVHSSQRKARPVSGWVQFKYNNSLKFARFKDKVKEFILSFNIWNGHMKQVEGLFGTGVLSYFTFLRWLLYLNVLLMLLILSFVFVPQVIEEKVSNPTNDTFSGEELLTGEGWFTHTKLYYGSYTNKKINGVYNMQLAYLMLAGGHLLLCVVVLASSMAKSYKENYIVGGESFTPYSSKVFCSWDYGITNKDTAKLRMLSIAQDMLESLGSARTRLKDSDCSKFCGLILLRLLMNIFVLALMAGSIWLIVFVSEKETKLGSHDFSSMIPAVVISTLNLVLPVAFRLISSVESYQHAQSELHINLFRTAVFKVASLIAYVVALHTYLTKEPNMEQQCWETFVGQAFYKLMIVDVLFRLLAIFFGEFIRKLFATYIKSCHGYMPGFDISRNVLDLIYSQGVCWIGTFYCPLLPVVHIIKLILFFYVKKISAVYNCRPSLRPFKASKMNVVFMALLSLMLILALIVVGYVIMDDKSLKPSNCGPFRGEEKIYSIVNSIIEDDLPEQFRKFIDVITSLGFITAFFFLLALLAYYFRLKKSSNEKKIKLLKHQLALAGQDKQYLLAKLRIILQDDVHLQ